VGHRLAALLSGGRVESMAKVDRWQSTALACSTPTSYVRESGPLPIALPPAGYRRGSVQGSDLAKNSHGPRGTVMVPRVLP
jgi:hypothetical protein